MILKQENLQQWKAELNQRIKKAGLVDPDFNYSDTKSDDEWIEDNIGDDVQDVIEDYILSSDWEEMTG